MPALGMAQETGKLLRWLKADGEAVAKGEPLMEVETDKVTVEIESPADGVLGGLMRGRGRRRAGRPRFAFVLAAGESAPSRPSPVAAVATTTREVAAASEPVARCRGPRRAAHARFAEGAAARARARRPDRGARRLRPVRRRQRGGRARLHLDRAAGRGRRAGRAARDVARLAGDGRAHARVVAGGAALLPPARRRRHAAQLLARRRPQAARPRGRDAHRPAREGLRAPRSASIRASTRIGATARSWRRRDQRRHRGRDRRRAVVPVVHGADRLGLARAGDAPRRGRRARARERKLRPDDVAGGTFTISNLGMFGVDAFQRSSTRRRPRSSRSAVSSTGSSRSTARSSSARH